jgi:inward rectifier potassium channel
MSAKEDPPSPRPYPRLVGAPPPIILGQDRSRWTDFYQFLLRIRWSMLFALMAAIYLAVNALFALLYLFEPGGIANARQGNFADAFFFSVQTLSTIGYGTLAPRTPYANAIVTIEAFVGILQTALATGVVFARVSRPRSRVMFSRAAVITPFDGVPAFMFRIANQRGNWIMEAEVTVTFARQTITREGHVMRRFEELPVLRRRSPLFAYSWTAIHPIDANSPLFGATAESLERDQVEIVVTLSGTDETYSDRIFARHSYLPRDLQWNKRFVDILSPGPHGRRVLDLRKFHAVQDSPP